MDIRALTASSFKARTESKLMVCRILFTSQKGGVGKSTLARSTAVALADSGRKVLLADFDTEQRTCLRWQTQRLARRLKPAIAVEKLSKEEKLDRFSREYDDVVMDTRGQLDPLSIELARSAEVIFLPSSFSLDDLSPTLRVVAALREAGIPPERLAVVFCRTGGSARQAQQARSILAMNDIVALDTVLPQRDGFVTLSATGRTGREAGNAALRSIAMAMDRALLDFIAAVTSGGRKASPPPPMRDLPAGSSP
jgi:chromosome partitioning protein